MEAATSKADTGTRPRHEPEDEELTDYCSRPKCRNEFRRTAKPGRRQAFCSEFCRRTAQNESRQAHARLAHYEAVVRKLRTDVAAFEKTDSADEGELPLSLEARQKAESAVLRAEGILKFLNRDDLVVQELRMLFDAVAPVIRSDIMGE